MKLFKYETHAHTSEVSKCSKITAAELVRYYKKSGFSGVCITDHFLNGNTLVPYDLPWEGQINFFCRGYEKAFKEGQKIGIDVFFGWEYSYRGTDFLTYGLDKEWLLNHPEIMTFNTNEYLDFVHESGGFIVHAHPFREADYIDMIRLLPRKVDAVEVLNACRLDFENEYAYEYANKYNLLKVAGTDNHVGYRDKICGIQVTKPFKHINDMVNAIKNNQIRIFTDINE